MFLLKTFVEHCEVFLYIPALGDQGWPSAEKTCLSPLQPGFNSLTQHHTCGLSLLLVFHLALKEAVITSLFEEVPPCLG